MGSIPQQAVDVTPAFKARKRLYVVALHKVISEQRAAKYIEKPTLNSNTIPIYTIKDSTSSGAAWLQKFLRPFRAAFFLGI